MKHKLAIFVSGSGTNMDNLIREVRAGRIPDAEISLIVCDKPEAKAIGKAESAHIPVALVDRKKYSSKAEFEAEIICRLESHQINWIVLAGFMRILSPDFIRRYRGAVINIHPSLLPAFPGGHSIKDAFDAKVSETGVTVHFVDEGVDTGPIILQTKVHVDAVDTLESLETKIHAAEYVLYPEAIRAVLSGKIRLPKHDEDKSWTTD